jgi:hypothetical protein
MTSQVDAGYLAIAAQLRWAVAVAGIRHRPHNEGRQAACRITAINPLLITPQDEGIFRFSSTRDQG